MLCVNISVVKMSDGECQDHCRRSKPSRDVISSYYIWLLVSWKCEDGNPCGEDIGECIHLEMHVSFRSLDINSGPH